MSDKVLAKVAGREITEAEFHAYLQGIPREQQAYAMNPQYREQYLDQLIALHMFAQLGEDEKLDESEEYAKILEESYAGISLMASPHPSYPPLEMASFGVKVITNTFANKDLKDFNENIISMNSISPDLVAQKLYELCNSYHSEVSLGKRNQKYCENPNPFSFIEEIKTILE